MHRTGELTVGGYRIVFEERGTGDRPVVLIHGLLLPGLVNGVLADRLARAGNRVILLDLLGHGRSDKPTHATAHRLEFAGQQVLALLDHLDLDHAVIGGMSLGANTALQVATTHPERVRALVCEMPVLERGTIGVIVQLAPLLFALRYLGAPIGAFFRLIGALPRTGHETIDAVLDTAGDPRQMAAVMHGFTAGPVCPPLPDRVALHHPTLVIGHRFDRIHPMDDAEALAAELPNARFVRAAYFSEIRLRPDRLAAEVATFLDEVWAAPGDAPAQLQLA